MTTSPSPSTSNRSTMPRNGTPPSSTRMSCSVARTSTDLGSSSAQRPSIAIHDFSETAWPDRRHTRCHEVGISLDVGPLVTSDRLRRLDGALLGLTLHEQLRTRWAKTAGERRLAGRIGKTVDIAQSPAPRTLIERACTRGRQAPRWCGHNDLARRTGPRPFGDASRSMTWFYSMGVTGACAPTYRSAMKTRAAVAYEVNAPWVIDEFEIRDPGPEEMLIRMAYAGLCHSDEHIRFGDFTADALPMVCGHEFRRRRSSRRPRGLPGRSCRCVLHPLLWPVPIVCSRHAVPLRQRGRNHVRHRVVRRSRPSPGDVGDRHVLGVRRRPRELRGARRRLVPKRSLCSCGVATGWVPP